MFERVPFNVKNGNLNHHFFWGVHKSSINLIN